VVVSIVFETHSWSEDNETGRASGWNHSRLSPKGRALAAELGDRRRNDSIAAVFTSDLGRAVETADIAFADTDVPILHDWRLRECNYGTGNGMPATELHRDRSAYLGRPYPGGESWSQAINRVAWFLRDLRLSYDQSRVLVIGHVATRWGLQHHLDGRPLVDLMAEGFEWQLGWEYQTTTDDS
jgi:alpha-ribazole phosphatase/probable phosphoglycerate mutase